MTVAPGTGALEATQQSVLSQLQSGINVSVTSNTIADTIATGNITAAQPTVGTPVAGGTVSITLGSGQGTWEAQLTGTFSSGTTIVFEGTDDSGTTTNWFTTVGYNTTVTNPPNIASVGGPGPFVVRGSASGYQQIRIRASALTVSDNIVVRLIGSNAPLGLGGLSTNDGSFAKETGGNLASIKSDADSIVTNTTGLATQATLASAKTDLDNILTHEASIDTATAASKTDLDTIVTNTGRIPSQGQAAMSASTPVVIASNQSTLPTSIASLPLPSGAATSAKQPALGTAGSASSDVLTVQGIAAMTPLKTDGSATTQPVSGTITANAGTNLNTSLLALETGGNLASIKTDADSLVTNTTGLATQTTLSAVKTDLDSIVTNTGRIPAQGAATTTASIPVNIASDQTVLIKGNYTEQASLSAGSLNADLVPSTDVSSYKWFSLHLITVATGGTITFQGSNDNTNFAPIFVYRVDAPGYAVGGSAVLTANSIYIAPVQFRYLRARQTAWSSGSSTGVLELYTSALAPIISNLQAYQASTWTVQPGNTPNTTAWLVNSIATSGGTSDYHRISTADTNSANVKASTGQIYGYDIGNNGASDAWVKLYNKASAPSVGTDTVFRTIYVPKGTRVGASIPNGIAMGTGIGIGITGGAADSDTTAVGAAQVTFELDYK